MKIQLKRKHKYIFAATSIAVIAIILFISKSHAVSASTAIYDTWKLQRSNMLWSVFRSVGWEILKFSHWLTKQFEYLYNMAINFLDFGVSNMLESYISSTFTNPLMGVLIAVGLFILGIGLTFYLVKEREKMFTNAMVVMICFVGLPVIMSGFTEITKAGINMFVSDGQELGTTSIIVENVTDFKYVDSNNFADGNRNNFKNAASDNVFKIDLNETIDPSDSNLKNSEIFKKSPVVNPDGSVSIEDADFGGWFGIGKSHYYRYNYDFITILLTLIASLFVFFFTSFKTIKLSWELAFGRIFALMTAPLDIASGARIKKVLMYMFSLYATLLFVAVSFRAYVIGVAYLSSLTNINSLARSLFIVFLALCVIDGPNLVERIIGVDAGLKSVAGTMMGLYTAGRIAKSGINTISTAASTMNEQMSHAGNSNNAPSSFHDSNTTTSNSKESNISSGVSNDNLNNSNPQNSSVNSDNSEAKAFSGMNIASDISPVHSDIPTNNSLSENDVYASSNIDDANEPLSGSDSEHSAGSNISGANSDTSYNNHENNEAAKNISSNINANETNNSSDIDANRNGIYDSSQNSGIESADTNTKSAPENSTIAPVYDAAQTDNINTQGEVANSYDPSPEDTAKPHEFNPLDERPYGFESDDNSSKIHELESDNSRLQSENSMLSNKLTAAESLKNDPPSSPTPNEHDHREEANKSIPHNSQSTSNTGVRQSKFKNIHMPKSKK